MGDDRVKLTKCDWNEVEWSKKRHYVGDILFEWPHV